MDTTILTITIFVLGSLVLLTTFLIIQEKKKVKSLEQSNRSLTNQVLTAKDRKKEVEAILHEFANYLVDIRLEANEGKVFVEKENRLHGMARMDHGEIIRLFEENPHSAAKALNNWLPYGKHLRTLEIVQSLQNLWLRYKKEMI